VLRLAVATSDAMHSTSRVPGTTLVTGASLFLPIVSGVSNENRPRDAAVAALAPARARGIRLARERPRC